MKIPVIKILKDACLYASTAGDGHTVAHAASGGKVTWVHVVVGSVIMSAPFLYKVLDRIQTETDAEAFEIKNGNKVMGQVLPGFPPENEQRLISVAQLANGLQARLQQVEEAMKETARRVEGLQVEQRARENAILGIDGLAEIQSVAVENVESKKGGSNG